MTILGLLLTMRSWVSAMSPDVVTVDRGRDYSEVVRRAAGVLADGGVVAFPTETLYGVGVRADLPDALEKLRRGKQRSEDKPFTVHLGRRSDVERYVPHPLLPARAASDGQWVVTGPGACRGSPGKFQYVDYDPFAAGQVGPLAAIVKACRKVYLTHPRRITR